MLHVAMLHVEHVVLRGTSYMYVINVCNPLNLIKDGSEL